MLLQLAKAGWKQLHFVSNATKYQTASHNNYNYYNVHNHNYIKILESNWSSASLI